MIDPHGSTGYGQAFTNNVTNNYGGAPPFDILTGLENALAKYPWMSDSNVVALGASYGGFMINWLNGHTTNKFNALVCHDGIFEQHSMMYYSTEEVCCLCE
jgi:dipeptidyl aminopeptidase/acylaminoacyl peptidase